MKVTEMITMKKVKLLNEQYVSSTAMLRNIAQYTLSKYNPAPLDSDLAERAVKFWSRYTKSADINWIAFYKERTGIFDERFVPSDTYYCEIDRVLNNPYTSLGISDKRLYYRIFNDIRQPKLIFHKSGGCLWDANDEPVDIKRVLELCSEHERVVLKPPVFSCGGSAVELVDSDDIEAIEKRIIASDNLIAQAAVRQHEDLALFNESSVNTVRLITYLRENGECIILSAVIRIGKKGNVVDNVLSGGYTCGICTDGKLNQFGYSNDGYRIDSTQEETAFEGHSIPSYGEIKEKASMLHKKLPQYALLAWDFAVEADGQPTFIEVNSCRASIDFIQLNNGPLFGPYTCEVLDRVYRVELI